MDIQRVNTVLNRAIVALQEGEIEAIIEKAMAGTYAVPSPSKLGFGYKPKPPSAFGFEPQKAKPGGVVGGSDDLEERIEFTKALVKKFKQLKKDLPVSKVRQGYKGTGGKKDQVQVFIDFKGDGGGANTDVFIRPNQIQGGVYHRGTLSPVSTKDKTVDQVYKDFLAMIKGHLESVGYQTPEKKKSTAGPKKRGPVAGQLATWNDQDWFYKMEFDDETLYLRPTQRLKNGNIKGLMVRVELGRRGARKAALTSINKMDFNRWKPISNSEIKQVAMNRFRDRLD